MEFFSQYNVRLFGKHIVQPHHEMDGLRHDLGILRNQLDGMPSADPARNEIRKSKKSFDIRFESGNKVFGEKHSDPLLMFVHSAGIFRMKMDHLKLKNYMHRPLQ